MASRGNWRLLAVYCGSQVGIGKGSGASDELADLALCLAEASLSLYHCNGLKWGLQAWITANLFAINATWENERELWVWKHVLQNLVEGTIPGDSLFARPDGLWTKGLRPTKHFIAKGRASHQLCTSGDWSYFNATGLSPPESHIEAGWRANPCLAANHSLFLRRPIQATSWREAASFIVEDLRRARCFSI